MRLKVLLLVTVVKFSLKAPNLTIPLGIIKSIYESPLKSPVCLTLFKDSLPKLAPETIVPALSGYENTTGFAGSLLPLY
ncbi:hypothetical protein, partial [Chryseobacterium indoltheticum]|uniref:hypothetical protein n=1 Tax=Chryseobacterium indoltheticum TaxID=254 RepID=UPI0028E8F383